MQFDDDEKNEIENVSFKRPHFVLIGAGASRAAFPNGDKNGNKLPLMDDFVEVLNIGSLLEKNNIKYKDVNFEVIYSEIYKTNNTKLLFQIEEIVYQYFSKLELPEKPTIYDHLVLCLRPKDVIATFNWDPFLHDAYLRNHHKASMPKIFFLHGNVRIGYCINHRIKGQNGTVCKSCGKPLRKSKLLYPIENKNYNNNEFIKAEWGAIKHYLSNAYIFSIFGYGAPQSDVEAIKLLKQGWGNKYQRNLEQVEVINKKGEDELRNLWDPFIHTHHYRIYNDFYDSVIANHPRRSCEAVWAATMEICYLNNYKIPKELNFDEFQKWLQPRINYEKSK